MSDEKLIWIRSDKLKDQLAEGIYFDLLNKAIVTKSEQFTDFQWVAFDPGTETGQGAELISDLKNTYHGIPPVLKDSSYPEEPKNSEEPEESGETIWRTGIAFVKNELTKTSKIFNYSKSQIKQLLNKNNFTLEKYKSKRKSRIPDENPFMKNQKIKIRELDLWITSTNNLNQDKIQKKLKEIFDTDLVHKPIKAESTKEKDDPFEEPWFKIPNLNPFYWVGVGLKNLPLSVKIAGGIGVSLAGLYFVEQIVE